MYLAACLEFGCNDGECHFNTYLIKILILKFIYRVLNIFCLVFFKMSLFNVYLNCLILNEMSLNTTSSHFVMRSVPEASH